MLCKCSGKYIDIYFILKITFLTNNDILRNFSSVHKFDIANHCNNMDWSPIVNSTLFYFFPNRNVGPQDGSGGLPGPHRPRVAEKREVLLQTYDGQDVLPHVYY